MKKKQINQELIAGRLYDCNLALRTVQNQQSINFGKEFINGSIDIATDEAGCNVLTVYYTYITEKTSNDKPDSRFSILKKIMEDEQTWLKVGKDNALKLRVTPAAALNDFYPNGQDQVVSTPRNEGGFINLVSELEEGEDKRNFFRFDTIITGCTVVDVDPETDTGEYAKLNAAIFNFKNDILPFPLVTKDPAAITYFMEQNLSASNPMYTQVWGHIENTTVKVETVTESAFGTPLVNTTNRQKREWVITGANPVPYEFGLEETITADDLKKAIADRNVHLEEERTRSQAYWASRGNTSTQSAPAPAPAPSATIPQGGFNF